MECLIKTTLMCSLSGEKLTLTPQQTGNNTLIVFCSYTDTVTQNTSYEMVCNDVSYVCSRAK